MGRQTLTLDDEGFVNEQLQPDTEARLNRPGSSFEYVAMNNDSLWAKRLGESQRRVDAARASEVALERDLIRAGDMRRTVEQQHADLEAERARYQAAIDGVAAPVSEPAPAEKLPETTATPNHKRRG